MKLGPIIQIALKDLRQRRRDRSARLLAFILPLALAAIFSLVLGDAGNGNVKFSYTVVNQDHGSVARSFQQLLNKLENDGVIKLQSSSNIDDAKSMVDRGQVAAAFVIPPGFSVTANGNTVKDLRVIGNLASPTGTLVARSISEGFANQVTQIKTGVAAALAAGSQTPPARLAQQMRRVAAPITLNDASASRKELTPKTFYAAGMAVFFLFFTVQLGISSLLTERREGTLSRLIAAPIPRVSILLGKALTSILLGLISMTVLVIATSILLGAHWGNPLGVGLLILAGVIAATCVMTLVATFARTPDQIGYWASIVALVLGMVGGSFFPVAQAGGVLAALSYLTPHAWFLRGLGDLSSGASATAVLPAFGAIMLFAVITGGFAIARSKRLVRAA
jgi:ABC-2 type transport system permease protein